MSSSNILNTTNALALKSRKNQVNKIPKEVPLEEGEKEKQIHLNQSLDFLACILSTCDGKQNLKQFTENLGQDFYKTSKNQIFFHIWKAGVQSAGQ